MNKQQLASRIWESANNLRSKIEANEYKDYILGFIFYKFLSDREEQFARQTLKCGDEEMRNDFYETNAEVVSCVQGKLGYFIAYKDLVSTWLSKGADFDVSNVREALSAFSTRNIADPYKKVFENVFATLETGLSKLGETTAKQTHAIWNLLELIKDIPMDDRQDYDVLGFIYEYLIGMFAANAGKKAGEFYTPHEVALFMAEVVADHLKDREEIKIYDPTSGSGSLLINIGRAVARHLNDPNKIKYYAQELKEPTYNLTRMNLVMRGILPGNIQVRNDDTLGRDWPWVDEANPDEPFVDAVVSNPPYSQRWTPKDREGDPRFASFGLAPKSKADLAFLLHGLYHLKSDGIMTIVMPHGVLFRGASEGRIRQEIINKNLIDAVIGLPENIFYGTSIPACLVIFKQGRKTSDVLFIDASKGFEKIKAKNKLRQKDIDKIAATYRAYVSGDKASAEIEKYSHVATIEEIKENDYNLNIPRYVDTYEEEELIDIDQVNAEIADLKNKIASVEAEMDKYLKELGLK